MKHFAFSFVAALIFILTNTQAEPVLPSTEIGQAPFEGRIDYEISNDGTLWHYTLWKKGDLWRSELSIGEQLVELRIGNLEERSAFLVNEAGKTYTSLSRPRRAGPPPLQSAGNKIPPKKKNPINLDKIVKTHEDATSHLGYYTNLDTLKGDGPKIDIASCEELGPITAHALPRFRKTEEKTAILMAYFSDKQCTPLRIKETGKKPHKGFSMVATLISSEDLDPVLLTIPTDYKLQMSRGPGGRGQGGGNNGGGQRKGGGGPGGGRGPR